MFHLLVKYNGWSPARDSLTRDRVFEYTDEEIAEQFKPGGILNTERITTVPALFLSETSGPGDQNARVGAITRTRIAGKEINIDYTYDLDIPSIPNSTLGKLAANLQVDSFEFTRSHWAIKDIDLFKVLFRNQAAALPSPKVFKLHDLGGVDENLVSVMMPFDPRFDDVYTTIKDTAKAIRLQCLRADDIWENDAIIQDVVALINRSRIVICDCTGRNANVFYEVGIAHTLGREVILITQSDGDIPFDLRHLRLVSYLNNGEGRKELGERLQKKMLSLVE